ncbi:MAG: folylpolyglutamate synthase/dihydrofolate synthase family protein [Candidatus Aenigmatarchaeota archaeon]
MKYEEAIDYLYHLPIFLGDRGLEMMKEGLKKFGNPEKELKIIHITGTNGKGSVGAMIQSILQDAGYKVGFFTSPHLITLRERIRINNRLISEQELVDLFLKVKEKMPEMKFFEFVTLMSIIYFSEQKVDYVILEVGCGGTMDATNISDTPVISVITNVGLDHTHILGETVEEIAKDKSGIIKQGVPVVTAAKKPEILEIIKSIAQKKDAKLIQASPSDYETNLLGDFQRINTGIAVATTKEIGIKDENIRDGLKHVQWPGRLQYLEKDFLVDGAHNVEGLEVLKKYIDSLDREVIIIFGFSGKRNAKELMKHFPKNKHLIFTQSESALVDMGQKKGLDPDSVDVDCKKIKDFRKAIEYARSLQKNGELILVTGSIYLVGDVMKELGASVE